MPKQQYRDDGCNPEILAGAKFAGTLEIPVVERPSKIVIPDTPVPFSQHAQCQNQNAFLVISEPDVNFSDILRNPEPYCQIANNYAGIITLEPALFTGAKLAEQIAVTQRNRTLAHCFQRHCVEVIPHLRWKDKNSYTATVLPDKIALIGLPLNSIVALETNSCLNSDMDKLRLQLGLQAVLEELQPQIILIFGAMPDEVFSNFQHDTVFVNYNPWPPTTSL
ncbi:MAG: DUF4417 domain-containing protein [bacterium]|nr:DUF4417 domain-containing protein [bacterium]